MKRVRTYHLICPICKQELKGLTKKATIASFKSHFSRKHQNKKWEDYLWKA